MTRPPAPADPAAARLCVLALVAVLLAGCGSDGGPADRIGDAPDGRAVDVSDARAVDVSDADARPDAAERDTVTPGADDVTPDADDATPDADDATPDADDATPDAADATPDADDALQGADDVATGPVSLTLLTFNLRTLTGGDGDDGWVYRRDLVGDVVREEAPDILATQEGWRVQVDDLAARLPGYAWAGVSRQGNAIDEYCAVFWRTDRLALVEDGTFWLSETPSEPGTLFSEAQCCPRIVTWVRLRVLATGRELLAFNTHFDTTDQDDVPVRSAALLARMAREIAGDTPAFALGDFNDPPDGAAWRVLTGLAEWDGVRGSFHDAWTELGLPEAGTFHGFDGDAPGARIDWVLATPDMTPTDAAIVRTERDGRYPSDHFPVRASFTLP